MRSQKLLLIRHGQKYGGVFDVSHHISGHLKVHLSKYLLSVCQYLRPEILMYPPFTGTLHCHLAHWPFRERGPAVYTGKACGHLRDRLSAFTLAIPVWLCGAAVFTKQRRVTRCS